MKSLFILAFLLTAAMAQNPCDCGAFVTNPISGTNDYSMILKYSLSKENIQPPPQTCNPVDKYQQWHHQCIYTLSCSTINDQFDRVLFFKSFNVSLKSGGSVHIEQFTITNPGILSIPLITFDEEFIPEKEGGSNQFIYAPNVLVASSETQYADLYFQLSSSTILADRQIDELDISIEFNCSANEIGGKKESNNGKTGTIIIGFILPLVITLIYIILAIVRATNPVLMSRVRARVGFKEVNEDETSMRDHLMPADEKELPEQPIAPSPLENVQEKAAEEKTEEEDKTSEKEENGDEEAEGEEV